MAKLHNRLLFLVLLSLAIHSNCSNTQSKWPEIASNNKPWIRWWWMGNAVDKPNIAHNLKALADAGFGGVEIAMVYGVKGNEEKEIEFLSPKWMGMLQFTIDEAQRLDMAVDLSNVSGWPFGGPHILPIHAASRVFFQTYNLSGGQSLSEPVSIETKNQKGLATLHRLMGYSESGSTIDLTEKVDSTGNLDWIAPEGNWKLIALFNGKTRQVVKRPSPGGEGRVMDHFSIEALETYLKRFEDAFATSQTSKPRAFFNDSYEVYEANWSEGFLDEFYKRRGYRLEDYLPEFLDHSNTELTARIKSDYRETMSEMLLDNFVKPWTNWTHKMGTKARSQAHGSPGNLLDIYGFVDIPECETFGTTPFDIPGLPKDSINILKGDADPMMLKFSSSAAHLAGLKLTSAETFTWLGNHFRVSPAQCKPELDQLFLSGINHVFYHGAPYSPKEAAWPGWMFYAAVNFAPADDSWRDLPGLTLYNARCQAFLQTGTPDNELLIYWPVYDNWHNEKGMDMPFKIHDIEYWLQPTNFYKTTTWLRRQGYDFDYISDHFLSMSEAKDGRISLPGGDYKALIIPETAYMPLETLQKIQSLVQKGARAIFIDSLPKDVPGFHNLETRRKAFQEIKDSWKLSPATNMSVHLGKGEIIVSKLFPGLLQPFNLKREPIAETGTGFIRRKHEDGYLYFFANQQANPVEGWIRLGVEARAVEIYDPLTGSYGLAKVRNNNNATEVFLQLEGNGSIILKTWNNKELKGKNWTYFQPISKPVKIDGIWKLKMIKGMPLIEEEFALREPVSWTTMDHDALNKFAGTGKYTVSFDLPDLDADDWLLDLGKVNESARVKINGKDAGIWWSIPFRATVGRFLKKGKNILEIEATNLAANRIADYDRRGIEWRIFKDINIVTPYYRPFNAADWPLSDSGLAGPVTLTPLKYLKMD